MQEEAGLETEVVEPGLLALKESAQAVGEEAAAGAGALPCNVLSWLSMHVQALCQMLVRMEWQTP